MQLDTFMDWIDLDTLTQVIARSPIVVAAPTRSRLPAGYDAVDEAVLEWIAAEVRRGAHSRHLMS